jgi:hypothetical protein
VRRCEGHFERDTIDADLLAEEVFVGFEVAALLD